MKYTEIQTMVESLGYPCSYYQFPQGTAVPPPFICWLVEGDSDLHADNVNYQPVRPLVIEFYTDQKDFAGEIAIEAKLTELGISYAKDELYLDSERMHETIYTMEVVINEQQGEIRPEECVLCDDNVDLDDGSADI